MNEALWKLLPAAVEKVGAGGPPEYYKEMTEADLAPGWARPTPSIWSKPRRNFIPNVWRYSDARTALERSGEYVPMELTERRNLIMVNPVEGNLYATVRNMVAAYQLILPGEVADEHRHTPHALRLILDGKAPVYTVVNGERIDMAPGDVVLTPGMHWHGHANDSDTSAMWIDVLDVPLVQHLESMFFEEYEGELRRPAGAAIGSPFRFETHKIVNESGLLKGHKAGIIPIATAALPTMDLSYIVLPSGSQYALPEATESRILAVISGKADVQIGDQSWTLGRGDVAAVPLWTPFSLDTQENTVVFSVSDKPVHQELGYYHTSET
ncbi:gentisate 1,2-dioxygenase protein (plasmid) [Rhizobium gallicum]|uniref:Gentisate 1,2-dioxygenase protein n=1 Tax=Rhizobium gallicum TaxID=56730 RepID=A0A1L5NSA2_9HYPH|nr:cupin domain-containing protein [Rhizobium gallicum]APO70719.1 gentisate 1,2-dioxygenase protein [Rhizobium gallicum]